MQGKDPAAAVLGGMRTSGPLLRQRRGVDEVGEGWRRCWPGCHPCRPWEEGDARAGPRRVADLIAVQIGSDLLKSPDKSWYISRIVVRLGDESQPFNP